MRTRTRRTRPRRRPSAGTRRFRAPGTRSCVAHRRGGSSIQPTITKRIAAITLQTRF